MAMCWRCDRFPAFREGACLGCLKAMGQYRPLVETRQERDKRFRVEAEAEVEAFLHG